MDRTQVISTYKGPLQDHYKRDHFTWCFERSAKICEPLDIEVKKPKICGRQRMSDNVEAESGRLL